MAMSPLVMTVPMKERGWDTATSFMPMLMNGLGLRTCMTWTLHASAMDERPGEGSLCDSGK